jgi:hypothetical protein
MLWQQGNYFNVEYRNDQVITWIDTFMITSFHTEAVWVHKANLTLPLFIDVPVSNQESERSCMCAMGFYFVSVYMIFRLDFGTVPMVWNILFFVLFE